MSEKSKAQINLYKWRLLHDESYMSSLEAQDILKSLKKLHNLTVMDLAMLWWMTPHNIYNILKGTRYFINLDTAKKIDNIKFITDGKWDWEHGLGHYKRVAEYVNKIE